MDDDNNEVISIDDESDKKNRQQWQEHEDLRKRIMVRKKIYLNFLIFKCFD
jgi:hypothetical protein